MQLYRCIAVIRKELCLVDSKSETTGKVSRAYGVGQEQRMARRLESRIS